MIGKILLYLIITAILLTAVLFAYVTFFQERKELNDQARSEIGGDFIALSQGDVFYELSGPDSGKKIILIHGAGSGSYAWDKNFDYLAKHGFRVLRYDLYGRGYSDRPDVKYDSTLFLNQLEEIITKLNLKKPYSLISVSMGSSIAIPFVKNHSEVENLILVDPASLGDGKIAWYLSKPILSSLLMSIYWYPRAIEKQMKEFYDAESVPEYRTKSKGQMEYKGLKAGILSSWQNMLTLNLQSQLESIGKQNTRVLVVWGKNDPLIHPNVSEHYLKAMPQASLITIDKAGHLSNYERPDIFNPAVLTFLNNEK